MSSPSQQRTTGPIVWALIAAILFGASTPASKPLVAQLGPLLLSGILYVGAALAVLPWAVRGLSNVRSLDRRTLARLFGAVVFGGVVGPVSLLTGLALAPAGSVALWLNLETVATALIARLFFAEHLGRRTYLAVALIVIASMLLWPGVPDGGVAALFVAAACIAWGLDNNLTAVIDRVSPAEITFLKGLVAGATNIALALAFGIREAAVTTIGGALAIGALSYGVSILLYIAASQHLGATRSQLVFSTAPLWGLALSWGLLGEPMQPMQIVSSLLMGLAIYAWHRDHHSHRHVHTELTHQHWHRHDDDHHEHEHSDDTAAMVGGWHAHVHTHAALEHEHAHQPDVHHRHEHG